MVIPAENSPSTVLYAPPDSDQIEEIQELNLLFLIHLRVAARENANCLGLPDELAGMLRDFPMSRLESIAEFPRSLFVLDLDGFKTPSNLPFANVLDQSRQALALTVLHSAWSMSRRRSFQARLFLRLPVSALRRLRTTSLSELPLIATSPTLLHCGFAGSESLWETLISRDESSFPRALRLIALHPDTELTPPRHILSAHTQR
jgi:hypothetical protein